MSLSTSHQAPEKIVPGKRGLCCFYFYKGSLPAFPLLLTAPKSCNRKEALSGDYFSGFRCKKPLFSLEKNNYIMPLEKNNLTPSSGAGALRSSVSLLAGLQVLRSQVFRVTGHWGMGIKIIKRIKKKRSRYRGNEVAKKPISEELKKRRTEEMGKGRDEETRKRRNEE